MASLSPAMNNQPSMGGAPLSTALTPDDSSVASTSVAFEQRTPKNRPSKIEPDFTDAPSGSVKGKARESDASSSATVVLPGNSPPPMIRAYAKLEFDGFEMFIQKLSVIVGRRPQSEQSKDAVSRTDVDLGPIRAVSRQHARLFFDYDTGNWCIEVLGRNGLSIDGNFISKGEKKVLGQRTRIQISERSFYFVLPTIEEEDVSKSTDKVPSYGGAAPDGKDMRKAISDLLETPTHQTTAPSQEELATWIAAGNGTSAPALDLDVTSVLSDLTNGHGASSTLPLPDIPVTSAPLASSSQVGDLLLDVSSTGSKHGAGASRSVQENISTGEDLEVNAPKTAASGADSNSMTAVQAFLDAKNQAAKNAAAASKPHGNTPLAPDNMATIASYTPPVYPAGEEPLTSAPPEDLYMKPPYTYASLIAQAVMDNQQRKLTLNGIYDWITSHWPYFRDNQNGWQNSIRHNLTLSRGFLKIARRDDEPGKGAFWSIDPNQLSNFDGLNFRKKSKSQQQAPLMSTLAAVQAQGAHSSSGSAASPPIAPTLASGPAQALPHSTTSTNAAPVPTPAVPGKAPAPAAADAKRYAPSSTPQAAKPGPAPAMGKPAPPNGGAAAKTNGAPVGKGKAPNPPAKKLGAAHSLTLPHPVVVCPIPDSYVRPRPPASSTPTDEITAALLKDPPIVLHEGRFILNPTIFANYSAEELKHLSSIPANEALPILQQYVVEYFKEKMKKKAAAAAAARARAGSVKAEDKPAPPTASGGDILVSEQKKEPESDSSLKRKHSDTEIRLDDAEKSTKQPKTEGL